MKERCKNRPDEMTERRSLRTNGTMEEAMMWKVLCVFRNLVSGFCVSRIGQC